jgi:AcrR family transcriptional regulator
MGAAGTPAWHAILDGAEDLLREEGYAALNAKRIAERINIKRQLVYYYFCDVDDLCIQLFHRIADRALEHLNKALESDHPVRKTWQIGIDTFDQTLILEFMALANRNEQILKAILEYIEVTRKILVSALSKVLKDRPMPRLEVPLPALAVIATWLAFGLRHEAACGINNGHQDVMRLIEDFVTKCEDIGCGSKP